MGSGVIWLDDVQCTGEEGELWQCSHEGWGVHNCDHSEDASVRCAGESVCLSVCLSVFLSVCLSVCLTVP